MRVLPYATRLFRLLLPLMVCVPSLRAQELPYGATPRGVVFTFLTETASGIDSIDRVAFRERLAGEFTRSDPRSFRGMLPAGSRIRIDTIPDLSSGDGELRRVVAYVTVETGGERENWYFFCAGDSIWRIEALRRFPSAAQRSQIRESIAEIDTTTLPYRLLRSDLQRLLLPDDSLRNLFRGSRADADKVVGPLRRGKLWKDFALRDVDFGALEEYRELDDDIDDGARIFYSLDRGAIERLKRTLGLRRIERDPEHPGLILFVAGAIDKSSYGYLYAPDGQEIPEVSSDSFITLKPIVEGWWLYKRVR